MNVNVFKNNTIVRHTKDGYVGIVAGTTSIKNIFTGNTACEFQYRVKIADLDKMKIAPFEDLEEVTDPAVAVAALGAADDETVNINDGRLKKLGYQIVDHAFEDRVDILHKFAIPKYGVNSVIYELGGFMISRAGSPARVRQYGHALSQWNRDINWIVEIYGKENAYPTRYREGLKKKLVSLGYEWQNPIEP